jgi:hypothetical protein
MPVQVDVHWVGLECRRRQEAEDEVAGHVAALAPGGEPQQHHFPAQGGTFSMGPSGERIVQVDEQVYSGPPIPLGLIAHLVEHDSGDLEGYKQRASKVIADAASQLLSSGVGMAVPQLDAVMNDVSRGLVDAVFDFVAGDDPYNAQKVTLDLGQFAAQPREHKTLARGDDPHRVLYTPIGPHQDFIVLTGGDDALGGPDIGEYGFYFDVRVSGAPDPAPATPVRKVRGVAAHSGKVLDVLNASMENETPIVQFDAHGGANQQWLLEDLRDGSFKIVSVHSGKVLDVTGFSMDNEAPIIQFDFHGGANQRWRLEDVGEGLSKIVSVHSGKVLDVHGASTDNLAPVTQFDFVGGRNQLWRVEPVLAVQPGTPHPGSLGPTPH